MNNTTIIGVLGCGWLGFPLAIRLTEKGFFVRGSTTSPDKLNTLADKNIDPFLVQFTPKFSSNREEEFFYSDIIIVNIPPKGNPEQFIQQMQEVRSLVLKHHIKKVIFISSTAVYGDTDTVVDEDVVPNPETPSGKAMLNAENLFFKNSEFQTAVIRFGGLIGLSRHPGKFFSRKKDIPNGKAPVNLIHLEDCIGIIETVIEKNAWNKIYNACSPQHPSRQDFYTAAAKDAELPSPQFKNELQRWKIVNSKNLAELNYDFKRNLEFKGIKI